MARGKAGPRPGPVTRKPKGDTPKPAVEPDTAVLDKGSRTKARALSEAHEAAAVKPEGTPNEHNAGPKMPGLTDEQEQGLFLHWLKKISAQKEVVDSAVSELRTLYKKAKGEGSFEKVEFDAAMAVMKRGTKKLEERIKLEIKAAARVGEPLQMELFGGPPDRTPAVDKAYEAGKRAAMLDEDASPPDSVQYRSAWMEGFYAGTEVRNQLLRMPQPKTGDTPLVEGTEHIPNDDEFERTEPMGRA